jgi:hypothetical protein
MQQVLRFVFFFQGLADVVQGHGPNAGHAWALLSAPGLAGFYFSFGPRPRGSPLAAGDRPIFHCEVTGFFESAEEAWF